MNSKLRLLAVGAITSLALTIPALAQDATPAAMSTSADGMVSFAAPNCDYGGEFKSIEATDASTVVFNLCTPDVAFPSKVAFTAFQIHSAAQIEATGGAGDMLTDPIGTGPWKFDHWDQGNEIVLTKFEDYWGDKAKEDQLIFQWNAEAAARLTQLQAGAVDGISNVGPTDFDTIEGDSNLSAGADPRPERAVPGLQQHLSRPFDNVKLRQAIDRHRQAASGR